MFAGAHLWTDTSWYQTGSPSLSSGKFGGRGSFLQFQQISKSPFVSVSLRFFHSDASENQQFQTLCLSLRLTGKKARQTSCYILICVTRLICLSCSRCKIRHRCQLPQNIRRVLLLFANAFNVSTKFHLPGKSHNKCGESGAVLTLIQKVSVSKLLRQHRAVNVIHNLRH